MSSFSPAVGIYTLGCKVNQYESESIAEEFEKNGFVSKPAEDICDVYVINTCTVTAESDRKARQFIRRAIRKNPDAKILVTGCFSQVAPQQISKIPGVDYICGNAKKLSVVEKAVELLKAGQKQSAEIFSCEPDSFGFEQMNITHFDRTRTYVKIEDGCENRCTYCIIPNARGKVRSKTPENVVKEVTELTENGCKEIVLTGIETASYGKDLENANLADLLEQVDKIPEIGRVRLGSLDPSLMKDAFVKQISKLTSLAPHFHLSLQSGSDRILALMKRKYNRSMALEGMERVRKVFPSVNFTTDVIVGFPGETEEDFQATLDFLKQAKFLTVHVFPYSRRAGTVADKMPSQIQEEIKHQRVRILSEFQKEIRKEILSTTVGKSYSVLFETFEDGYAIGHTPEFFEVKVPSKVALHAQTHPVLITDADSDVCFGVLKSSK